MSRPPFPLWALGRGLLCGALVASDLHAQDSLPPWEGGLTASLGQPTRLRFYAGGTFGLDWRRGYATGPAAYGQFGVTRSLLGPDVGLLAASVEAFGGLRNAEGDGGARVLLQLPVLRLALGGEYNFRDDRLGVALGLTFPMRRGGVFRGGSLARIEWTGGPLGALRTSVLVPVAQPTAGRTRPLTDRVAMSPRETKSVPAPPPAGAPRSAGRAPPPAPPPAPRPFSPRDPRSTAAPRHRRSGAPGGAGGAHLSRRAGAGVFDRGLRRGAPGRRRAPRRRARRRPGPREPARASPLPVQSAARTLEGRADAGRVGRLCQGRLRPQRRPAHRAFARRRDRAALRLRPAPRGGPGHRPGGARPPGRLPPRLAPAPARAAPGGPRYPGGARRDRRGRRRDAVHRRQSGVGQIGRA